MSPLFTHFYNYLTLFYNNKKHSLQRQAILSTNSQRNHKIPKKEEKMRLKKRYFVIGAIILVIAFILGWGLFSPCGKHRFCDRDFPPGFHGKDFSEHVLGRLDKKVGKLDLSETQQEKYQEIRSEMEADFVKMRENRKAFIRELQNEFNRENPDINAVASLLKEKSQRIPGLMGEKLDRFLDFYNILDEDQKAQVIKKFREKIGKVQTG